MDKRDLALFIWEKQLGKPYIWGGDDSVQGFDCSGLVLEGLKSVGLINRGKDFTSAQLAEMWPPIPNEDLRPGMLLFWTRGSKIGHVEIVWRVLDSGLVVTIGASGGGSKTTDAAAAARDNAYTKIRPVVPGWVRAVDPFA
jgi:cell wall-associated NlpC family hydrolase